MKVFLIVTIFFAGIYSAIIGNSSFSEKDDLYNFREEDSTKYKVYEIDSINAYYIIYATNKNEDFKIVSEKSSVFDGAFCDTIKVGKSYNFKLNSIFSVKEKTLFPRGMLDIHAWKPDQNTTITLFGTGTSRNLYFAENIRSLCFFK